MDTTPTNDFSNAAPCDAGAASGSEELAKVCREQDRAREALRRKLGDIDIAVELVRDARAE